MNQTEELIAKKLLLNSLHPSRYINWSMDMLVKNISTESIQILAGLGENEEMKVIEKYFEKSLSEINFLVDEKDILEKYSFKIACEVISNKISPRNGLKKVVDIYFTNEDENLYPFLNVYDFYDNQNSIIIEEFKIFLKYRELNITVDLWNLCYCKICEKLTQFNQFLNNCYECNSTEVYPYQNQDGRKIILKYIENHQPFEK
jgi:hypothetical protein